MYVAKVGDLEIRWSRPLPAAPTSVTATKDAVDRYWASFVVDTDPQIIEDLDFGDALDTETGIDVSLAYFAVLSNGKKIDAPRFLRQAERKLKRMQKALSCCTKGSNNRPKARKKVARQHARVADRRFIARPSPARAFPFKGTAPFGVP
ncbi:RNA-guided endonuclease InsQ/TnpB family protein [Kitasatospora sp. NPDC089509]|uniref:RNA-guided endonuclease InsQ/TnpB family protein n=1 Tax=Kitasatospora sp. NPDC089509 TaxID=3364079 RepID=UPI0037FDCC72